jgi:hypothetical protein
MRKQEEHSVLDIKNTFISSEKTAAFPHIQTTGHVYIQNNKKYYGCHKDRKEGQIFKCLRKKLRL